MNVYEIVTDKIIKSLNEGMIPWQKPWNASQDGVACNLITGKPYKGINVWLLAASGFSSPYWLTFNQVKAKGGQVLKGAKSTMVVFWKRMEKSSTANNPNLAAKDREYTYMLRYYNVFNVEQTSGVKTPEAPAKKTFNAIESADAMIKTCHDAGIPSIQHGGNVAKYIPSTDAISLPNKADFTTPEGYYSTAFHEIGHATGHASRMNREMSNGFGSHDYSKEELVAEMFSAFMCAFVGIDKTINNSAAYIQGWLHALKNDSRMVIHAASQAQKAIEYIIKPQEDHDDVEE